MMNAQTVVQSLSASNLLSATRELVQRSCDVEAELLVHLGEIDERMVRKLPGHPNMLAETLPAFSFGTATPVSR